MTFGKHLGKNYHYQKYHPRAIFIIFRFSRKVKHAGLSKKCVDAAIEILTIDNVIQILEKSIFYEEMFLEEACWG